MRPIEQAFLRVKEAEAGAAAMLARHDVKTDGVLASKAHRAGLLRGEKEAEADTRGASRCNAAARPCDVGVM